MNINIKVVRNVEKDIVIPIDKLEKIVFNKEKSSLEFFTNSEIHIITFGTYTTTANTKPAASYKSK